MHASERTPRSRAAVVVGAVAAAVAVAVIAAGAVLVAVHATQRDGDGYYASGHNPVSTPTRALVSDDLEVDTGDAPGWLLEDGRLGTLRVTASGTDAKPVFVGIAPTGRVNAYLRGVDRAEITDFELDPFSVDSVRHPGTAVPAPPATRSIWAASATGSGEQAIEWPVDEGDWSVVVMNADGSAGVATDVSVGARVGFVLWLGLAIVAAGVLLLVAGIVAVVAGRRPPAGRPAPAGRLAEGVS
jgi:hypothetical protein